MHRLPTVTMRHRYNDPIAVRVIRLPECAIRHHWRIPLISIRQAPSSDGLSHRNVVPGCADHRFLV